jgi:hypothetical protein
LTRPARLARFAGHRAVLRFGNCDPSRPAASPRPASCKEQLFEVRDQLEQERQERERVSAALAFIKRQDPNGHEEDEPPPRENGGPAHKTRVEGEDNVYSRRHADGSIVYLVLWTEDGKPKSKTVGEDLADALALRDELRERGLISRRARPAVKAA